MASGVLARTLSSDGKSILKRVKCVLIDLNGTLHTTKDVPTEGAVEALQRLRDAGLTLRFVTNTTVDSRRSLIERLGKMGFLIKSEEMFTSLIAAREFIQKRNLNPFFIIDPKAMEDLDGFNSENPNAVLIGLAPSELNFENLNTAFRLVLSGAELIAVHKGKYYRDGSQLSLGPGPFVRALEFATGKEATVVGKPDPGFFSSAVESAGCELSESVMIGDDLDADVVGAMKLGIGGILVKTGKYQEGDESKVSPRPDLVSENFSSAVDTILSSIQK